jgi:dihydroorotate dehydrogenase electron transfer subunit
MNMKQFKSQITRNTQISADFFKMSMKWDADVQIPDPGQFLTIRVSDDSVPLLRRPFAFAGFDEGVGTASIIYQKRGRGTEILAAKKAGEMIDVVGPLGNVFPVDDKQGKSIVVAGGIGLGPILFLADYLRKRDVNTNFIFGCRNKSFIPDDSDITNAFTQICTDDGSAGFKGNVVEYINANIKQNDKMVIYGCGPLPMLKNLYKFAESAKLTFWASLEEIMACGVGACMGCAVPTVNGYLRACKEGPVLNGRDVKWEQM